MIAGALILDPDVLIADEPTTALDVTTQAQILKLMQEMQAKTGCGILFITHDFGVVRDIADKIIVMQQGKVVETGGRDLLDSPKADYTKMLLAAVPSMTPPKREPLTTPVILDTQNLVHIYKKPSFFFKKEGMKALNDVSFSLKTGETLGVVGESGSGKSTVARAIARLIDPASGAVTFENQNLVTLSQSQLRPLRREMQMVFQDPFRSLNPRRTIEQNLLEGPMNFGVSYEEAIARAKELLATVKMQEAALPRFPHQFSGGQRQRLAIARALMMRPKLILADEPVSALDVSVQKQVLALFEEIKAKFNLSMIFITHDLRVAAQICDRIAVMSKGKIVELEATQQLFTNPQHSYTQALFKAAPGQQRAS
jgi:peptide/nickel transport system ATP-binding protein